MLKIAFLSAIIFFISCTTTRFSAKPSLIKPWSEELSEMVPQDQPYVARFSTDNFSLSYVAASHEYGIHSATLKTIEKEITIVGPKIVIVEGISELDSKKRERIKTRALSCEADSFLTCGENLYGIALAVKNGLAWTSAEPEEKLIHERLLKRGFSLNDISFFYVARQIKQLCVEKNLSQANLVQVINATLADFADNKSLPRNLNAGMFLDWFARKMHSSFVLSEIDSETTAPTVGPNMTFLNQISAEIAKIRDENITRVITQSLNQYARVLVVYGGSHFMTQREVLVDMLGQPKIIKHY